jgi:hypothetical protein
MVVALKSSRRILAAMAAACGVLLTLAGVTAAAEPFPGPAPTTEPTAPIEDEGSLVGPSAPSPQLSVSVFPSEGVPGTAFEAIATPVGFPDECVVSFSWEYGTPQSSSTTSATFVVPQQANAATYPVTASCNEVTAPPATFTVTRPPVEIQLTLSVTEGRPGTPVGVTISGCPEELQPAVLDWEGEYLDNSDTFTVPVDASPGPHSITATCGSARDTAEFAVTAVPQPSLTLGSDRGEPGSGFTATGSGFDCGSGDVEIRWDDAVVTSAPAGVFDVPLTVPADATPRGYTVRAACTDDPDIADNASFTVTQVITTDVTTTVPPVVPQDPTPATLTLAPSSAGRGDTVTVTGQDFLCDNNSGMVTLVWDNGDTLPDASADSSGVFQAGFLVPPDADAGRRTLRASCAEGAATATASFSIVAGPVTPTTSPPIADPPPEGGFAFWVLVLIIVAVMVAVLAFRRWRKSPPPAPNPRVHVEPHVGGPPTVALHETPGQRSFAIRLQIHAEAGRHTITEVPDDHNRP